MSYQLNKFEKTTGKAVSEPEEVPVERALNPYPLPFAIHNYENVIANPLNNTSSHSHHRRAGTCPCGTSSHHHPHQQHYCPDCERETKRSRTRIFGSGGDVFVDKNHGYANTSWTSADADADSNESQAQQRCFEGLPRRRSQQMSRTNFSDNNNKQSGSGFRISLNVPAALDFDHILKTQKFSINISITEASNSNKTPGRSSGTSSDLTCIKENRDFLAKTGWYYQRVDWQVRTETKTKCSDLTIDKSLSTLLEQ